MPRIRGANSFHLADVSENTEENYTVGKPYKAERLISIEIDTKKDSETLYSDDEVEEDVYGTIEMTGKVTFNYLTNETKVKLFGGSIDTKGVYFPPIEGGEVLHKAMGFKAPTGGGKNKFIWYQDVVFSEPKFKAESAENKPKTQTVEVEFKCYKNKKIGRHYCDLDQNSENADSTVASQWFDSVYSEIATAQPGV